MFKKILYGLILTLIFCNVGWGYGIVNNSGSLAADSISIPFFALDSAGNMHNMASGDSVFLNVFYPSGALAYRDSLAYNGAKITSQTVSDYTEYTWKEAIADIDGTPVYGNYSYILIVNDQTSSALASPHKGHFQLINSDFDDLLDSAAYAQKNNVEVLNINGWGPILDNDSLIIDQSSLEDMALSFNNFTGDISASQLENDLITAAKIADDAIDYATFAATAPTAWWNEGKTGYALTTADWNVGKTGYSLSDTEWEKVWHDIDTLNIDTSILGEWLTKATWLAGTRTLTVADWTTDADLPANFSVMDILATGEVGVDFSNINGTLDAGEIGTGALTSSKFATGAITSTVLATAAITANVIAADAFTSDELAASFIGEFLDSLFETRVMADTGSGSFFGWLAQQIDTNNFAEIADVWRNQDTVNVDSSDIGVWLVNNLSGAAGGLDTLSTVFMDRLCGRVTDTVWKSLVLARNAVVGSFADSSLGWGQTSAGGLSATEIMDSLRNFPVSDTLTGKLYSQLVRQLDLVYDSINAYDDWIAKEASLYDPITDSVTVDGTNFAALVGVITSTNLSVSGLDAIGEATWMNIDTLNIDTSLIGEWLATNIGGGSITYAGIADTIWGHHILDDTTAGSVADTTAADFLWVAGDSSGWATPNDFWRNIDTIHVDTSLIGIWLSTGINATIDYEQVWYNIDTLNIDTSQLGEWLITNITTVDSATIARSVWNTPTINHVISGSFGDSLFTAFATAGEIANSTSDSIAIMMNDSAYIRGDSTQEVIFRRFAIRGNNTLIASFFVENSSTSILSNATHFHTSGGAGSVALLAQATGGIGFQIDGSAYDILLSGTERIHGSVDSIGAGGIDAFWNEDSTGHYTSPHMAFLASQTGSSSGISDADFSSIADTLLHRMIYDDTTTGVIDSTVADFLVGGGGGGGSDTVAIWAMMQNNWTSANGGSGWANMLNDSICNGLSGHYSLTYYAADTSNSDTVMTPNVKIAAYSMSNVFDFAAYTDSYGKIEAQTTLDSLIIYAFRTGYVTGIDTCELNLTDTGFIYMANIPSASGPDMAAVFLTYYRGANPVKGAVLTIRNENIATDTTQNVLIGPFNQWIITDSLGQAVISVPKSYLYNDSTKSLYQISLEYNSRHIGGWTDFYVPNQDTVRLVK